MTPTMMAPPRAVVSRALSLVLLVAGCAGPSDLGHGSDAGVDGGDPPVAEADSREECGNGMDDDADGAIDEGCFCAPGESQSCFSGEYPNRLVGACGDGVQACGATGSTEFGTWESCVGDTLPISEVCDGIVDDDCDGAIDEECPCAAGETRGCGVEFLTEPCTGGEQRCRADGTWSSCEGAVGPSADVCDDDIDNDCDGTVNEGCECLPEPELCDDAVDNDCDGVVDEPGCIGEEPPACATPETGIVELIGSYWRMCARHEDGRVLCWGSNQSGGLGVGDSSLAMSSTPLPVIEGATGLYANSELSTCVLGATGASCWGVSPTGTPLLSPIAAPWAAGTPDMVALGVGHLNRFSRRSDGSVWSHRGTLTMVIDDTVDFDASDGTQCVVRSDGSIWCWGSGQEGQTGLPGGLGFTRVDPVRIDGVDDAVDVEVGRNFVCALRRTGEVVCWGADGTRGDGALADDLTGTYFSTIPTLVPGMTDVTHIESGRHDTCVIRRGGELWCWGYPQQRDMPDLYRTPQHITSVSDVVDVGIGFVPGTLRGMTMGSLCVLERCGRVRCWGENRFGTNGDGTTMSSSTPVDVVGLP